MDKEKWILDVRVGCVAVYPDNEITRSHLPCIPDPEVCLYFKSGKRVMDDKEEFDYWTVKDEDLANAQLIAAAPELYEALKELTSQVSVMGYFNPEKQEQFRQAIAKVEK